MGAWLKLFEDGTSERGSDADISKGKSSWSQGCLNNIKSVQIFERRHCCVLNMPNTNWHQYDRYIAPLDNMGNNASVRIARVMQAEIKPEHIGKNVFVIKSIRTIIANLCSNVSENGILISQEHVGLWVTMYILINGQLGILISERGAFHGDKQIFKQCS